MVNVIFEVPRVTLPLKSTYPNHLSPLSTSYLTIPLLSFYLPSLSLSLKHLTSSLTTELEWPSMPPKGGTGLGTIVFPLCIGHINDSRTFQCWGLSLQVLLTEFSSFCLSSSPVIGSLVGNLSQT